MFIWRVKIFQGRKQLCKHLAVGEEHVHKNADLCADPVPRILARDKSLVHVYGWGQVPSRG